MIRAAEEIAVERGLGATTLTAVQQRAGQANKSAARYHFGSRDGLLDAVLGARMSLVDADRRAMLEAAGEASLSHAEVAAILIHPLANHTLRRPGSSFARFLMQVMADPVQANRVQEHVSAASFRDLQSRFHAATSLSPELATLRFGTLVILSIASLATWEGRTSTDYDLDYVIDDLVRTATAVLDTPAH